MLCAVFNIVLNQMLLNMTWPAIDFRISVQLRYSLRPLRQSLCESKVDVC
jgi:hypothetical protein